MLNRSMTGIRRMRQMVAGLWSCDRGAVAPLVGLAILTLVAAVGVAVDVGRGQVALSKLQASLDSAGLAAGAIVGQSLDEAELKAEAEMYLNANFSGETIDASITAFNLVLSNNQSIVTLDATATLPTTFMQIFGQETMQVAARSEITRVMKGLEVALVLDVTGSMNNAVSGSDPTSKISALRTAATDLVSILFGSNATVDDLYVGIVPFSQSVNVGTSRTDWSSDYATRAAKDNCIGTVSTSSNPRCPTTGNNGLVTMSSTQTPTRPNVSTRTNPVTLVDDWLVGDNPPSPPAAPGTVWYFKPHGWGGCFEERYTTGDDVTDETPEVSPFKVYFFPDNSGNNWLDNNTGNRNIATTLPSDRWANKSCPRAQVLPMTNVKATLTTAITNLQANGNTILPVGLVWGWRMLSPKWRNKWGGEMDTYSLPLDYAEPLSQKAVIFMTDGINDIDPGYGPYGPLAAGNLGTTNETTAETVKLPAKTLQVCNALKANGVLIYTLVFGSGSDTATKNLMKACASEEDFFFDSPSSASLQAAFKAIGDSLSKLRISK